MLDLTPQVNTVSERIHALRDSASPLLVAISGPPGAGKSTLAAKLARRLNDQKCTTDVLAMDGFHLDNRLLEQRGLLQRKGAPETFDAEGFLSVVERLRRGADVIVPDFVRERDLSIAGARAVSATNDVIIIEGNYLLFDETPWRRLQQNWDLSVWLDVVEADLRPRLIHRWLRQNLSSVVATRRAEQNDLPNARRVKAAALPADIVLG